MIEDHEDLNEGLGEGAAYRGRLVDLNKGPGEGALYRGRLVDLNKGLGEGASYRDRLVDLNKGHSRILRVANKVLKVIWISSGELSCRFLKHITDHNSLNTIQYLFEFSKDPISREIYHSIPYCS